MTKHILHFEVVFESTDWDGFLHSDEMEQSIESAVRQLVPDATGVDAEMWLNVEQDNQ